MRPDEIKQLLGGYATGTLTEDERRTLFQAALQDQELFNALAGEQALKDLLDDPSTRGQLLAALDQRKPTLLENFRAWLLRPSSWAIAGGVAAALVLAVVVTQVGRQPAQREQVLVAQREAPRAPQIEPFAEPPAAGPPVLKDEAPPSKAMQPKARVEQEAIQDEKKPAKESAPSVAQGLQKPVGGIAGAEGEVAGRRDVAPAEQAQVAAAAPAPPPEVVESRAEQAASVSQPVAQSARELFYSSPAPQASAFRAAEEAGGLRPRARAGAARSKAAAEADLAGRQLGTPVGVRYNVLRREPAGGYTAVDPGAEFRAGDLVRLSVEPNAAGYLQLFRLDPSGEWQPVYGTRVEARTRYEIPPQEPIRPEAPRGELTLRLSLSRTELREGAPRRVADDSASGRIIVESVTETIADRRNVDVVYAVDPNATPDSPVVVDIHLKFR